MVGSIFRFWFVETFEFLKFRMLTLPSPFGGRVGEGWLDAKTHEIFYLERETEFE
jgi:hypothetical protein